MRTSRLTVLAGLAGLAAYSLPSSVAPLRAQTDWAVVATGLDNPRGLAFAPDGSLYVAEAGRGGDGPCVQGAEGAVCYGPTGALTRVTSVAADPHQSRLVSGLPSLAPPPSSPVAGHRATGPHDVDFQGAGNGSVTIGLGNDPTVRAALGVAGARFGRLLRVQPNGSTTWGPDVSGYEAAANPDAGAVDSNPYGLASLPGRNVVTDAGGNSLIEVAADGTISTLAVFPVRLVPHPFAPPPAMIPMQAVPTTVVRGPDGAYYVGQLTGFPFPPGGARVYRVPASGGAPTLHADGFTNIIDIAFGPDGSLYVLEIAANGLLSGDPTGALIRVARDGTRTTLASAGLESPGGIAIGRDGAIYITNHATSPGTGEVVRLTP